MSCAKCNPEPVSLNLPTKAEPPFVPAVCDPETVNPLPTINEDINCEFDELTNDEDTVTFLPPIMLSENNLEAFVFCEPDANMLIGLNPTH